MDVSEKPSSELLDKTAMDVEFLPIVLIHKIHRNLKSSQVEIVPQPYYQREPTPEEQPEIQGEAEPEIVPPPVVYAAPLPALRERKNWWDFFKPVYSFNNQRIRARVELLMTSRIVHITDRKYWVRLQEKIKEDYAECLKKRIWARAFSSVSHIVKKKAEDEKRDEDVLVKHIISYMDAAEIFKSNSRAYKARGTCPSRSDAEKSALEILKPILESQNSLLEVCFMTSLEKPTPRRLYKAEEVEREKSLLLKGKISYEEAPLELKRHPVCRINQIAQRIIRYKKAKSKKVEKTSAYRTSKRRIRAAEKLLKKSTSEKELEKVFDSSLVMSSVCIVEAKQSEDVEKGLMFSQEDFDKLKYEDPLIKLLREAEAVEDMYSLADRIVGSTEAITLTSKK